MHVVVRRVGLDHVVVAGAATAVGGVVGRIADVDAVAILVRGGAGVGLAGPVAEHGRGVGREHAETVLRVVPCGVAVEGGLAGPVQVDSVTEPVRRTGPAVVPDAVPESLVALLTLVAVMFQIPSIVRGAAVAEGGRIPAGVDILVVAVDVVRRQRDVARRRGPGSPTPRTCCSAFPPKQRAARAVLRVGVAVAGHRAAGHASGAVVELDPVLAHVLLRVRVGRDGPEAGDGGAGDRCTPCPRRRR